MKRSSLIALLIACSSALSAQHKPAEVKPFIIEGQLKNFKANEILLAYTDLDGERVHQSAPVDANGNFHLETNKINSPVPILLGYGNLFHTPVYAAPGSHLKLTADCIDKKTYRTRMTINGYGALASKYILKLDSVFAAREESVGTSELPDRELVVYLKKRKHLRDSLLKVVYNRANTKDNYYSLLKTILQMDAEFDDLDAITFHITLDTTKTYQQAINFVNKNADKRLLADLYKEEYMQSNGYRVFMRDGYYSYLEKINRLKGTKYERETYNVDGAKTIAANYKGSVKRYVLNSLMKKAIKQARSFAELNLYGKEFPAFITMLDDKDKASEIRSLLASREKDLISTQIGRPAPELSAATEVGKKYNLADFKGKVVLVDLWASWCAPCRYQTPYLKKTFEKYKNDDRIAFVSVAVADKPDAWKKAMEDDKPTWLQLYDTDGSVGRNYFTTSIPKFIVVNKEGNIVSFDAPMPSSPDLEKMLLAEMSK